jgi:hypothetical protein
MATNQPVIVSEEPQSWTITRALRVRSDVGPIGVIVLMACFGALSLLALYTVWAFWPSEAGEAGAIPVKKQVDFFWLDNDVSRETLFFVTVAVSGALGGMVHVLRSLVWYTGNRLLKWRWVPFYVMRPVLGAAMATLLYFLVRAGFFSPSSSTTEASPYGFAALAALGGLFSDHAAEKLRTVASELFQDPPQGSDSVGTEGTATPAIEVDPARERVGDMVALAGTVNPRGMQTSFGIEWGETTAYGNSSPAEAASVGAGVAPVPVHVQLTGLDPAKEYHYRFVAVNGAGTVVSDDQVLPPVAS